MCELSVISLLYHIPHCSIPQQSLTGFHVGVSLSKFHRDVILRVFDITDKKNTPRDTWARLVGLSDRLRVTGLVLVGSQDQTESAAILKIKESMQEEAKRFEKDSDHPDYFIQ